MPADADVLRDHRHLAETEEHRGDGGGVTLVWPDVVLGAAGERTGADQAAGSFPGPRPACPPVTASPPGARRMSIGRQDVEAVAGQLGRQPRGVAAVAHRCACGLPDVIETAPALPDGTPFPTLYYLTCVRACAAASRLEASGLMREMTSRLGADSALRESYLAAHRDYADRRQAAAIAAGVRPMPPEAATAGGMPDRIKCLHALVAHELAVPGANPLGREAILAMGRWWAAGPCVRTGGTDDVNETGEAGGADDD